MTEHSHLEGNPSADLTFRALIGPAALPGVLDRVDLADAYAWPDSITVRANMIASLDGAVTGPDGRSGTLSDVADRAVFNTLRTGCDAIVVGAGTARAENYGPAAPGRLLVVVSRTGQLPERLLADSTGVVLALPAAAAASAPRSLPRDQVWAFAGAGVAPVALLDRLRAEGRRRILHEGGPRLLADWLADGCIDELCLTRAARLLGGGRGLLPGSVGDLRAQLQLLLESRGTLLGRWQIVRDD